MSGGRAAISARILDGRRVAADIKWRLEQRVAELRSNGVVPGLGTLLVGDDPGSRWYVGGKHRDCAEVGIGSIQRELPATATQSDIEAVVADLDADEACTGYIVQLPLPAHIDTDRVLAAIDPAKDADGLHPQNLGALMLSVSGPPASPLPCTPRAVIELIRHHDISLDGAHIVVVGRGVTVGRPIGSLVTQREINATVTLTHTGTIDLARHLRQADVIVAAAGVPGLIQADHVRAGAVVLDVGVSRAIDPATGKSRVHGDVHPDVYNVAGWVSPNPGGVGPMTRALLLQNVVEIAERSLRLAR